MDEYVSMDRKMKMIQMRNNLIKEFNQNKYNISYNERNSNNIDNETLFSICLPSFIKNVDERDKNDQILITIFLFQIKNFIKLYKDNMVNSNEKLDVIKFYDSLKYISTNIMYSKFNSNRLLMRFGEEGKKFYLLLKGEVAILIPIKKVVNITINEYKRYIALLIIYKEFKLLFDVLKDNSSVYDMKLDFLEDRSNHAENIILLQNLNINNVNEFNLPEEKHLKDLVQLLDLYLTEEEKKFYMKYVYNKVGKFQEEYDDGIFLSQREYISRINAYSDFDFEDLLIKLKNIKKMEKIKKEEEEDSLLPSKRSTDSFDINNLNLNEQKSFLIYEYHKVTELFSGEMFGDLALSSSTSLRTATIVTITECHFAFLKENIYSQSIKEYNEKKRKNMVCYLCNIELLKSISYKSMEKKYFNHFVFKMAKKNEIILKENQKNLNIIFFKEGVFEISFRAKINDICNIINHYYEQLENITKRKNDIDGEILQNVILMNRQKAKVNRLFFNDLDTEYDIKLFLVNAPSIFGMGPTEKEVIETVLEKNKKVKIKEYYSYFEVKCNSLTCEYVLLDKNLFEKEIKVNDKYIKLKVNIFLREFYGKLIRRLLVVRYGRIWNLFIENGITNEQKGLNIDWSKIELNQDFTKGINKLIETINECKFLSNDIEKNLNQYFENERMKNMGERQLMRNKCHKNYSYNRVKEILNIKNNIINSPFKNNDNSSNKSPREHIQNILLHSSTKRSQEKNENEKIDNNNIKKYNFFKIKHIKRDSQLFNNIWINKNLANQNKNVKSFTKSNSCMSVASTSLYSSKAKFPSLKKININKININNNKRNKVKQQGRKNLKKLINKKVSFYYPKLNSVASETNIRLHLNLYDTFKVFRETYSLNPIKREKNTGYY